MEVYKLNEAISRLNFYETPGIAWTLEQKYLFENKIKELEKENRVLLEEKGKIEVNLSITTDRYAEMKRKYEDSLAELDHIKMRHSDQISSLENRVSEMKESYDVMRVENKSLKHSDEKHKQDLLILRMEKDSIEESLMKSKLSKEDLKKKVSSLEMQVKTLLMEKDIIYSEKKRLEDERKMRNEMRGQYLNEMKSNINTYRHEIMRSRSKK